MMQIKNTLFKIFTKKYHFKKPRNFFDTEGLDRDTFTPSMAYQKIQNLQPKEEYFKDKNSFLHFTNRLESDNLIDGNEKIALHFLAQKSPHLDMQSFDSLSKHSQINQKMQKILESSIRKLAMIEYITSHSAQG
ncbi:hypothetical protein [Helicobacter mustelae]|uniref:hypothetical protein n=1 Tax=Helicobacter mustelae TaxID=217 RepID=UPI0011C017ED|nr:hypothetical protein [Helicobacter mustelae]